MHPPTGTSFAFLVFALTKFILKRSLTSLGKRHCMSLTSCHTISIITQERCKKFPFQCSENVTSGMPLHATEFELHQELANEFFNE